MPKPFKKYGIGQKTISTYVKMIEYSKMFNLVLECHDKFSKKNCESHGQMHTQGHDSKILIP